MTTNNETWAEQNEREIKEGKAVFARIRKENKCNIYNCDTKATPTGYCFPHNSSVKLSRSAGGEGKTSPSVTTPEVQA